MMTRHEAASRIALAWERYRDQKYQELEDQHLAQWEYMNENPELRGETLLKESHRAGS